jgi:glycosyltransferase involved in cell wall biosynthesis
MSSKTKIKVIVSCSGKFHAFALAEQLDRHGMLYKLYTSYSSIKNPLAKYLVSRRDRELILSNRIKTFLPIAFGLKLYKRPLFWNDLFDRWVARQIKRSEANVFIGWSGMSLRSIKAAKAKGMITILERGSSHIDFQDNILKSEFKKFGIFFEVDKNVKAKEKKEYDIVDFISIPSEFVENSFLENGIEKLKLIKNNYGTSSTFNVKSIEKINTKFTILYLGSLNIRKGLIYFFQALELLEFPDNSYEVRIIGRISPELNETFKKFRKPNWNVLGHINHYDLPNYIKDCSVAIHPSLEEGLSMVIPQILACEVPVIATTNSGGGDIIIEGRTGFIVPIRSSESIAEKINLLYNNPGKLTEMKKFIANNEVDLTWDAYGDRYIEKLKLTLK